jgi:hypothetical protein
MLLLALLMFVGSIAAQTVKVNVKDSQGEAVIGATVLETGTSNGSVLTLMVTVQSNLPVRAVTSQYHSLE